MPTSEYKFLLFGSTGAIGSAIAEAGLHRNWSVVAASRKLAPGRDRLISVQIDPFANEASLDELKKWGPYSAVCWAQGANLNDSIYTCDADKHLELYKANCLYVIA